MSENALLRDAKIERPVICGAMYPCSNVELVAAASEAGGIGIVQPLSLVFVHKHDFREGLRKIKSLTSKPIGMNIITEQSAKKYKERMEEYLDIALEEGVRFFVTSLGNPKWVVDRVSILGGVVYHDVTALRWGQKAKDAGVKGLICVNNRAGGHAGDRSAQEVYDELKVLGLPLVCAGGVSTSEDYREALEIGYSGVQMGTRFIASVECSAHEDYKRAIVEAQESDIVLTDLISGVPVSVIKTPYIEKVGTKAGWLAKKFLQHRKLKHYARLFYSLKSAIQLKKASTDGAGYKDYWQAGKSVRGVEKILSVREIMDALVE